MGSQGIYLRRQPGDLGLDRRGQKRRRRSPELPGLRYLYFPWRQDLGEGHLLEDRRAEGSSLSFAGCRPLTDLTPHDRGTLGQRLQLSESRRARQVLHATVGRGQELVG